MPTYGIIVAGQVVAPNSSKNLLAAMVAGRKVPDGPPGAPARSRTAAGLHAGTGRQRPADARCLPRHVARRCRLGRNAARRALYRYLELSATHTEAREPDSPYVFTSQRAAWLRQQQQPDHITVRGISHLWAQLKARATHDEWQLIAPITFHDLRHDWAHRARAAGWSLEEIAVYGGHQTKDGAPAIATTVRYTLPSRQQLKEQLQRLQG